jgi:hypothetical protein
MKTKNHSRIEAPPAATSVYQLLRDEGLFLNRFRAWENKTELFSKKALTEVCYRLIYDCMSRVLWFNRA